MSEQAHRGSRRVSAPRSTPLRSSTAGFRLYSWPQRIPDHRGRLLRRAESRTGVRYFPGATQYMPQAAPGSVRRALAHKGIRTHSPLYREILGSYLRQKPRNPPVLPSPNAPVPCRNKFAAAAGEREDNHSSECTAIQSGRRIPGARHRRTALRNLPGWPRGPPSRDPATQAGPRKASTPNIAGETRDTAECERIPARPIVAAAYPSNKLRPRKPLRGYIARL